MFRLFKAELKKLFLKPSIFVVTGLIILLLALSSFFYSPNTKNDFNVIYSGDSGKSVGAIFNQFDTGTLPYDKATLSTKLNSAENYIDFYATDYDSIASINARVELIKSNYDSYVSKYHTYLNSLENGHSSLASDKTNLESARVNFKSALTTFDNYFNDQISSEFITVLSTKDTNLSINSLIDKCLNYYNTYSNLDEIARDGAVLKQLEDNNFYNKLKNEVAKLLPFNVDKSILDGLRTYITTAKDRLGNETVGYYSVIYDYNDEKSGSSDIADIKQMKRYVSEYNLTANYAYNIVIDSIKINGLQKYGAFNINQFSSFEKSNLYQMQEKLIKTKYMFDTDTFEYDYADVFSISQPSNNEINGFDYSYFALRLCALFITIYVVVIAASTIAGELSAGTLNLLAIRPYKRGKILTGKILATLAIGAILLAVCSVATLVIGGISYGFAGGNILLVFNSTSAAAISPVVLYLIAIVTMFIEISFYALLSVFISTVFKSNIGAVAVSILIFFLSLIFNIVAVNAPILSFLPFTNINLFKYLGGAFIGNNSATSVLQGILTPTVFAGASFWLSFAILIITEVALCYVTYLLFSRRDIK